MAEQEVDERRKLFVGGLNYATDDKQLAATFGTYGVIEDGE